MSVNITPFGILPDGDEARCVALSGGGLEAEVLTYGGTLRSLRVPSRRGPLDVALGFDSLEAYRAQTGFCGAIVGRCANRIGGSRFTLGGREYLLPKNDGENHLHGGPAAFDKRIWTIEDVSDSRLVLSLVSADGDAGYPGRLDVRVTYTLADGALAIDYRAVSDADTVCNLTSHAYFNLSGHGSGPVSAQRVSIFGDAYTPTDAALIPTGAIEPVEGTPMDLRAGVVIGEGADVPFEALRLAGGFDQNWAVSGEAGTLRPAARAVSDETGVCMDVLTTQPGVQFYSGNGMDGFPRGKGGAPYARRWGFCLETQAFPDAVNHPNFPSPVLKKGAEYHHRTVFRFSLI